MDRTTHAGNTALAQAVERRFAEDSLAVVRLGRIDYDEALEMQEELRERRIRGEIPDLLLLLEHPPVYTLGRGASPAHLGPVGHGAIPIRRVGRGGQVTFHGLGQLIGYPIIDLGERGADVRVYLRALEEVLIRAVAGFGLESRRQPGQTGVWVEGRKLASIGVGIKRWVTAHGFALNVNTDLSYFASIVPCGLPDVRMTSLDAEGLHVSVSRCGGRVGRAFAMVFGYQNVCWCGTEETEPDVGVPAED